MEPFDTVLVANRGEIAVRVIRTLRRLGIRSVAVYSDADAGALHVREADEAVRLGPAPAAQSYLDADAVLRACRATGARAVHPGYGFLAENAAFARALAGAGIEFIGPGTHALEVMGDKIRAKNHVAAAGVPTVPGVARPGLGDDELVAAAAGVGYPLLIKPSAGGGGKGMVAVEAPHALPEALASARRTARGAFGDDTLLLERLVRSPRHIEVQVLADAHGRAVHLGERECSLQRRHQKVIEEAPAPLLEGYDGGAALRGRLGRAAVDAALSVGYVGAGTVEFLVSDADPDEFFFMEMNTRLQVEHPVTEEVVRVRGERVDLVEWQVRIAAGERLDWAQEDVALDGHAIEARVYAEDPASGFLPSTGRIFHYREPAGPGIRVDAMLDGPATVGPDYDPMVAKVIAHGPDRATALARLDAALARTRVFGVATNTAYLRSLLADPAVAAGRLDTTLIDRLGTPAAVPPTHAELAAAAHRLLAGVPAGEDPWHAADGWRAGRPHPRRVELEAGEQTVPVEAGTPHPAPGGGTGLRLRLGGRDHTVADVPGAGYAVDGHTLPIAAVPDPADPRGHTVWVGAAGGGAAVRLLDRTELLARQLAAIERGGAAADPEARAPMPGTVVSLAVASGDRVDAGQKLVGVEAMKMEHALAAAVAGTVTLHARLGDQVGKGQVLATVHPDPEGNH